MGEVEKDGDDLSQCWLVVINGRTGNQEFYYFQHCVCLILGLSFFSVLVFFIMVNNFWLHQLLVISSEVSNDCCLNKPHCCFVWYSSPSWKSAMYSLFLGACIYILKYEISFDWVGPANKLNTCCCLRLLFSNLSFPRFWVLFKSCNFWCLLLDYSIKLFIVSSSWSFSVVVSVWWFVGCGFFP